MVCHTSKIMSPIFFFPAFFHPSKSYYDQEFLVSLPIVLHISIISNANLSIMVASRVPWNLDLTLASSISFTTLL
jgi:hypothetical protein